LEIDDGTVSSLYIIAGPNGAGKTTFIKRFAPRELALLDFINADEIARGLAPLAPQRELLEAGRLVLERFRRFVDERRDFCLETTLSGRTYRKYFELARRAGYHVRIDFLLLPGVEDSIPSVADRVEQGGHDVSLEDLRRRFKVCVQNLFTICRPVIDRWSLCDNGQHAPVLLAYGDSRELTVVAKEAFEKVVTDFSLSP
jgi:predicted ABC-type ATPase